ncbi:hypothetical protein JHK82_047882 [Glycine max]|nr:hypothetical protein JHK82_047882 [Glycine max]
MLSLFLNHSLTRLCAALFFSETLSPKPNTLFIAHFSTAPLSLYEPSLHKGTLSQDDIVLCKEAFTLTRTFNTSGFMKFWNKRRMKKREASEEVKHVGENGFAAFKVIEEEEEEEEKGSGGLRNLLGEEFARRSGGCCFWMNAMWVTTWRS